MPEGLVMGMLTLSIAIGVLSIKSPHRTSFLIFGLMMGLGALSKHNYIVLGLLPLTWICWRLKQRAILPIGIAALVAGPWYILVGLSKQAYVQSTLSSSHHNWASVFAHLSGLAWDGLGPILAILTVWALKRRRLRNREKSLVAFGSWGA